MINAVTRAPPRAASESTTPPADSTTIDSTAAVVAPDVTPMTSGLASGLRRSCWKIAPARPNAVPASRPTRARGSRNVCTM
jgi:hypothetical protein